MKLESYWNFDIEIASSKCQEAALRHLHIFLIGLRVFLAKTVGEALFQGRILLTMQY